MNIIFSSSLQDDCDDYMNTEIYRYLINISVALCVSIINYFIKMVFKLLSHFERYKSITALNNAIMKKIFVATFINMGLLYLIINANFQGEDFIKDMLEIIPGGSAFFKGDYSDLNREWYPKVAVNILVLVITNLVSVIISTFIFEGIGALQRKYLAKKQILQHDMNNCMNGREFLISMKYASSLAIVFV